MSVMVCLLNLKLAFKNTQGHTALRFSETLFPKFSAAKSKMVLE